MLHHHGVLLEVPLSWESQTSITLLDAAKSSDLSVVVLDVVLNNLYLFGIGTLSISFDQSDILLGEGLTLFILHGFLFLFSCLLFSG